MSDKFRLLRADEIECRVSTINERGLTLLLYKDARVDQNILDETFGIFGWQRSHQLIGDRLYCTVSVKNPETGEWISKQDVGTESYTEKEKGQASDSFKRACFNLGIGRELYTAPFVWIPAGYYTASKNRDGKPTTYDRFSVKEIGYQDGKISSLVILNRKTGKNVYAFGTDQETKEESKPVQKSEQKKRPTQMSDPISPAMVNTIKDICKNHNIPESVICERYQTDSLEKITMAGWRDFSQNGKAFLDKWDSEHGKDHGDS